jgi:F-type H+-transporting ATPase subunit a
MTESPLDLSVAFTVGPVAVSQPVVITWGIMVFLGVASWLLTRRMGARAGTGQAVLELVVGALDDQIRAAVGHDPARFRTLVGTLFLFILTANWSSLVPGIEPPTAHLETDAALAGIVFVATIWFGITSRGLGGYLKGFAEPSWVMLPTRTVSLMVRLFGNVMSGVFVVGIVLSLAGLLVPIPLMALDLLTGAVQAYIFATLALVFIASAVSDGRPTPPSGKETS